MLAEFAVTPDVLCPDANSDDVDHDARLSIRLLELLLDEGLVADLRDGEWQAAIRSRDSRSQGRWGTELLKALVNNHRLLARTAALDSHPETDLDWCKEAIAAHKRDRITRPLDLVVSSRASVSALKERSPACPKGDPRISSIDRLDRDEWRRRRSCSVMLDRTADAYIQKLRPILARANWLALIDPHLDPKQERYRRPLERLFIELRSLSRTPQVEIHRWVDPSHEWRGTEKDWKSTFEKHLSPTLRDNGLKLSVFVWPEKFHDRYLVTDLVGIMMSNGFDADERAATAQTTWARLDRDTSHSVRKKFDANSTQQTARAERFRVPKEGS